MTVGGSYYVLSKTTRVLIFWHPTAVDARVNQTTTILVKEA
jgi:hypothetical protein